MYEQDVTEFIQPNKLDYCPHCGMILKMYPFGLTNFGSGVGKIKQIGRDSSYRVLRCINQHMFVVIGALIPTFGWPRGGKLRRFEIKCDSDFDTSDLDDNLQKWDEKYLKDTSKEYNFFDFFEKGLNI